MRASRPECRHKCPICGREAPPRGGTPGNPSFPFCSPACKCVDLGRWFDGSYRVPGPPLESALELDDEAGGSLPDPSRRRGGAGE